MHSTNQQTTVIGLGSMGWGAASSLLRAGIPTRAADIRPEALEKIELAGGKGFVSPAEAAAGSRAVFIFVVNREQTEKVLFGPQGAAATMAPDGVVIGCATVPPAFAEQLGERLADAGRHYIDAPVSGGPLKALEGAMTMMASGSNEAFAAAAPMLDAIATKVYRLGAQAGAGSRMKMINQLLAGIHIASACEAVALGIQSGIEPAALYEVICDCAGSSWMFENRVPHIISGDYSPASAVDIFVKDLGIVVDEAQRIGFSAPVAEVALDLFKQASAAGFGRDDDSSVVKIYAEQAGLKLPGQSA